MQNENMPGHLGGAGKHIILIDYSRPGPGGWSKTNKSRSPVPLPDGWVPRSGHRHDHNVVPAGRSRSATQDGADPLGSALHRSVSSRTRIVFSQRAIWRAKPQREGQ